MRGSELTSIRREQGFTLVEMLVALMLFSVIAGAATLLAFTATRSFAISDGRLAGADALNRTRALLTADLAQAAARPTVADTGALLPAFWTGPEGFVAVRRGVNGVAPSVQKIAWGFDGRRLLRQSWPTLDGSAPENPVVMLDGLQSVRLRVATAAGWQDRWQPQRYDELPLALELTIVRADGVPVVMKFLVAA